ncbi:monovalent cation/H(+) antiporter subunit G [Acetohalobium arabaticum]|uniref:Monovalent cation/proton antiporter, MnhG/PhaG subunit n=1 Tax=Acetohalobium arabaticum (strain ATCC 49924 / DSM 5501 / Z-7288) TaxID=574087 RepID=D9QQ24_ACEAZ|nr:monovalent cation/H(+) antiporter subunit G [Acetohalobium arabaticum]ADL12615.1 monovalent cation/proton antiporter, MnhG/PhaG subunit [Acetohalobium arabaticum DSM 5501]
MSFIIIGLIFTGVFFFIVGTIGLIRLPDTYSRIHAPTKCDTLGLGLIISGMILYNGLSIHSVKMLLILIFLWITGPAAASVISKAAIENEVPFSEGSFCYYQNDELKKEVVKDGQ